MDISDISHFAYLQLKEQQGDIALSKAPLLTSLKEKELSVATLGRSALLAHFGWASSLSKSPFCCRQKKLPPNFSAELLREDRLARLILLLAFEAPSPELYQKTVEDLFVTADLEESISLYLCLPLLPHTQLWQARAREALRSNIPAVFCAIAQNSDFASRILDTLGWHQMILKAVFLEIDLSSISGLTERNNFELARSLLDYLRERRAAGRDFPSCIWLAVAPFFELEKENFYEKIFKDLPHHSVPFKQAALKVGSKEALAFSKRLLNS